MNLEANTYGLICKRENKYWHKKSMNCPFKLCNTVRVRMSKLLLHLEAKTVCWLHQLFCPVFEECFDQNGKLSAGRSGKKHFLTFSMFSVCVFGLLIQMGGRAFRFTYFCPKKSHNILIQNQPQQIIFREKKALTL